MTDAKELLPCPNPWCEGEITFECKTWTSGHTYSRNICSCGVKGPETLGHDKDRAGQLWNTRPSPDNAGLVDDFDWKKHAGCSVPDIGSRLVTVKFRTGEVSEHREVDELYAECWTHKPCKDLGRGKGHHIIEYKIQPTEMEAKLLAALSSPIDREAVIRECAAVAYQMFNKCTHCDTEAFAYEAASKAILALIEQEGE